MDDHFGRGGGIEEAVADGGDIVVLQNLENQSMMSNVWQLLGTWCSSRFCCVYRRKTVPISSGGDGNMSR